MSTEITLIVPICAKPECREETMERLKDLAVKTRTEEGNICYILHEGQNDDKDTFYIYERWKDEAALDFHMNQEYLKDFLDDSSRLLTKKITGIFCSEINV